MSDVIDVDVDFSQASKLGLELVDRINKLRDVDPLYWSEKQKAWIASGHAEVTEGFSGTLPLSAKRFHIVASFIPDPEERARKIPYLMEVTPSWVTNTDPPEQTRLRRLMLKAFSRSVAESYRPFVRQTIAELFDRAAEKRDVEFIEDVSRQVPARVILKMLGLDDSYLGRLKEWAYYSGAGQSGAPTPEILVETNRVMEEMRDAFMIEIEKRRANPTDDFISSLVHAREGSDQLTINEIVGTLQLTLIAGHNTTSNSLAMGTMALSEHPEACDYIREHPEEIGTIIMELMRYIAMSTSMARIVTEDFTWRGRHLKKGQFVHLMIIGANRDPAMFPHPEQIDFSRPQDRNMVFGPGQHHCIGHLMAKMQLSEFFPELVRRFDRIEVTERELQFSGAMAFRGPEQIHMRLHPRL
jgi:cytochrome P450